MRREDYFPHPIPAQNTSSGLKAQQDNLLPPAGVIQEKKIEIGSPYLFSAVCSHLLMSLLGNCKKSPEIPSGS